MNPLIPYTPEVGLFGKNDGHIRCKCTKEKCLNAFSDCFASGFYCDESCSCEECKTRPDFKDMASETCGLPELRNPLAFFTKSHCLKRSREEGDQSTLIPVKQKTGCSCRKTLCIKKYCRCYQARIGCSDECHCVRCENVFGKNEERAKYNDPTSWTPFQHSGHKEDTSKGSSNRT